MSAASGKKTLRSRIVVLLVASFLSISAAELAARRFTDLGKEERKILVDLEKGRAHCYTSNPRGAFPHVLVDKETGRKLYCVIYDYGKRRQGYFPARSRRVALVGDSFVFGIGVKDRDTLAYQLDLVYPEINFMNLGEPAYDLKGASETVCKLVDEGFKDIIYVYNINDVVGAHPEDRPYMPVNDLQNLRAGEVKMPGGIVGDMISKSVLFRSIYKIIALRTETDRTVRGYRALYSRDSNRGLDEEMEPLAAAATDARKNGVSFRVVIYPLFYKDVFGRYPFDGIHAFVRGFCEKNGISCVDTYPVFERFYSLKGFTVHPVDYHPNGLANRMIAEYLAEEDKLGLERSSEDRP